MSNHSPLPWSHEESEEDLWRINDANGDLVTEIPLNGFTELRAQVAADTELVCRAVNAHDALVEALKDQANWHSLCLECGPNVTVDEDGCCSGCGATAIGEWLERHRIYAAEWLKR